MILLFNHDNLRESIHPPTSETSIFYCYRSDYLYNPIVGFFLKRIRLVVFLTLNIEWWTESNSLNTVLLLNVSSSRDLWEFQVHLVNYSNKAWWNGLFRLDNIKTLYIQCTQTSIKTNITSWSCSCSYSCWG